jgi:metal-responsive CopG/Arc/MetJ family transcriptional regulator
MSKGTYLGLWIPKRLIDLLDLLVEEGYFRNRSEAIRTAIATMITILKPYLTEDLNLTKPTRKTIR